MESVKIMKTERGEGIIGQGWQTYGEHWDLIQIEWDIVKNPKWTEWIEWAVLPRLAPNGRIEII